MTDAGTEAGVDVQTDDINGTLNALTDRAGRLTEELAAVNKATADLLPKALVSFVRNTPGLTRLTWVHYTPAFNDGDPCEFHTTGRYPDVNGWDSGNWEWDDEDDIPEGLTSEMDPHDVTEALQPLIDIARQYMGRFNDEVFYQAFGDQTKVVVTKDRLYQEYYDCGH